MAKGFIGASGCKAYLGAVKLPKGYIGSTLVYSAGNTVTYHVTGVTYQEDVDEGGSCLSPSFTVPAKPGYTFLGWADSEGGAVLTSKVMGDDPITLYAVYVGNPHVFSFASAVAWTAQGISNGVNRGKQTFTGVGTAYIPSYSDDEFSCQVAAGGIKCRIIKGVSGYFKSAILSANIPTGGCKYLDITYNRESVAVAGAAVNGVSKGSGSSSYDGTLTFNVSGKDSVSLSLSAQDQGSGVGGTVNFTRLYFHN